MPKLTTLSLLLAMALIAMVLTSGKSKTPGAHAGERMDISGSKGVLGCAQSERLESYLMANIIKYLTSFSFVKYFQQCVIMDCNPPSDDAGQVCDTNQWNSHFNGKALQGTLTLTMNGN